ncbi:hypothetical protein NPIL_366401 [Nephila pilipes]|uniref:Uncharacterized protein n=1 Tax=Nephila pilipes TaxID=299642 RepID=A0A8X6U6W7_NEPPI|nr:hypothetical protein NPIL_366401 [Nephila pilipes]
MILRRKGDLFSSKHRIFWQWKIPEANKGHPNSSQRDIVDEKFPSTPFSRRQAHLLSPLVAYFSRHPLIDKMRLKLLIRYSERRPSVRPAGAIRSSVTSLAGER